VIVYLYIHLPTEMGYVGSTESPVHHRFNTHWVDKAKEPTPLHQAMMGTSKTDWDVVVLETYDTLEEMLRGELEWMLELETFRPKVGFNSQIPSEREIQVKLRAARQPVLTNQVVRTRADMSAVELEYYREQGRKGAAQAVANRKVANNSDEAKAYAKLKRQQWWADLTLEQQEAHNEKCRQGGAKGGTMGGKGRSKQQA